MDFSLCPFHHLSTPTGGGVILGSDCFRKALAKVQGGAPRLPYAQFDLQRVRPQLVGSALTSMACLGQTEETGGGHTPRAPISQPRGRPPKGHAAKDGAGNSPSSSPDRGWADSDGYSTASEAHSTHHCRRWHGEKQLVPACLDMPIFKSTDPNADVMYTLWRFDMQGWLDQYQEESMMPHICASLWRDLGRWVSSLEDGPNLTVTKLLEHMDHAFGDVCKYHTMICSLYEIRQKEGESLEEYMLQIHEAIAVICCTYLD